MTFRPARVAIAALVVAGCYADPGGSAIAPPSPAPTRSAGVMPSDTMTPSVAAQRLLAADAAQVELSVVREKRPADPIENLVTGSGRVEPSIGRGHVSYDLSGLSAPPGATAPPAAAPSVEVIWTPDDLYVLIPGGQEPEWQSRTRDEARRGGGLVGRLPDEVLGLVTLVAESDPGRVVALDDARIEGARATRWLVPVTVEEAVLEGVPADAPDAAVIRQTYGITDIEIEAWLVEGALRRLRVAFARENAPYGGPDRTTTTYDWRPADDAVPIEIPPLTGG